MIIDEGSSDVDCRALVEAVRAKDLGRGAHIMVVSRRWRALRPSLDGVGVRAVLPLPLVAQMVTAAVERITHDRAARSSEAIVSGLSDSKRSPR